MLFLLSDQHLVSSVSKAQGVSSLARAPDLPPEVLLALCLIVFKISPNSTPRIPSCKMVQPAVLQNTAVCIGSDHYKI